MNATECPTDEVLAWATDVMKCCDALNAKGLAVSWDRPIQVAWMVAKGHMSPQHAWQESEEIRRLVKGHATKDDIRTAREFHRLRDSVKEPQHHPSPA